MNGPQMDIARVSSKNEEDHLRKACRSERKAPKRRLKTAALLAACINAVRITAEGINQIVT